MSDSKKVDLWRDSSSIELDENFLKGQLNFIKSNTNINYMLSNKEKQIDFYLIHIENIHNNIQYQDNLAHHDKLVLCERQRYYIKKYLNEILRKLSY